MKVSVIIGSRNRPVLLARCLRSVISQTYPEIDITVLDDASSPPLCIEADLIETSPFPIRLLRSDRQLGCPDARNQLMDAARGDVFFSIDDDAYIENENAIACIVQTLSEHPRVGVLATRIIDYRGGSTRPLIPHSQHHVKRDRTLLTHPHHTSYFLGGGQAIRRTAIEASGGYDASFEYGHEELDLSYRILGAGYYIYYQPEVLIHHKPPPGGDQSRSEQALRLHRLTRNRILFAYKHLPHPYLAPHIATWLSWYGWQAIRTGMIPAFVQAVGSAMQRLPGVKRSPLHKKTIAYLKRHHGRLWR